MEFSDIQMLKEVITRRHKKLQRLSFKQKENNTIWEPGSKPKQGEY